MPELKPGFIAHQGPTRTGNVWIKIPGTWLSCSKQMNSSWSETLLSRHASISTSRSVLTPCPATWAAIKWTQHKPQDRGHSLHNRSQFLEMELSICSLTERQDTSYEDLQIGNIPYILDTGRVGKKKKYICWAEEAIRAMESSANQLLGNLCLVPSKTFCENVLTNVKNKSFPFFFP